MELHQRIVKARKDAKLTQEQLAQATGKSRGAVTGWENGSIRPRQTTLEKIAEVTGKALAWLENESGETGGLDVIGRAAAGVWREGTVEFQRYKLPVTPHPDYPAWSQALWEIEGTSINKLAREGEYLHAVDVMGSGIAPQDEDIVIVRRIEHDVAEYTAKVLRIQNGRKILRPDSTDPQWQQEITLNADDSSEIAIIAIVIAKWSPLGRRARSN